MARHATEVLDSEQLLRAYSNLEHQETEIKGFKCVVQSQSRFRDTIAFSHKSVKFVGNFQPDSFKSVCDVLSISLPSLGLTEPFVSVLALDHESSLVGNHSFSNPYYVYKDSAKIFCVEEIKRLRTIDSLVEDMPEEIKNRLITFIMADHVVRAIIEANKTEIKIKANDQRSPTFPGGDELDITVAVDCADYNDLNSAIVTLYIGNIRLFFQQEAEGVSAYVMAMNKLIKVYDSNSVVNETDGFVKSIVDLAAVEIEAYAEKKRKEKAEMDKWARSASNFTFIAYDDSGKMIRTGDPVFIGGRNDVVRLAGHAALCTDRLGFASRSGSIVVGDRFTGDGHATSFKLANHNG